MLHYDLGEMRDENGSVLRYRILEKSAEYAVQISQIVESSDIFKKLSKKLPSVYLPIYFRNIINKEIFPVVFQACIIKWYKRNNKPIPHEEETVLIPRSDISNELIECWGLKDIPLKMVNPLVLSIMRKDFAGIIPRRAVKARISSYIDAVGKIFRQDLKRAQVKLPRTIACHYAEGLDPARRNDLNWYWESGIDPSKVLIYFNMRDSRTSRPVERKIIQQIENYGFRWVALKQNVIENQGSKYWSPHRLAADALLDKNIGQNPLEKWIIKMGNELLGQVHYWRSFYNDFNICIHYLPEEGFTENIAQAIAFDINKKNRGFLVGKQRSEIFLRGSNIGHYAKHIFFVWNERVINYLKQDCEHIKRLVMNGYPNDILRAHKNRAAILKSKGAKFVIALFDNWYADYNFYSEKGMNAFYQAFLKWMIDDPAIGLVIKSKKPYVINNLSAIQPLLNEAIATGRCIRIEDEWGRFPSEASFGADMAVGVGISSAVMEAVIAGCRGIHYDMTNFKNHEFYKWGYNRIIFNDLETLLSSLKKYKDNSQEQPMLGDWSLYMDKLDPFRDGKGGERMGTYMRWLLESFERGESRDEAIRYASRLYAEKWGGDKIGDLKQKKEGYFESPAVAV